MEDPGQSFASSFVPPFASRTIYDPGPSTSQLSQYAGPSTELYGIETEVSYQRQYPAASGLPTSSCSCLDCPQGGTHELYYPNRQQLPTMSYFPQRHVAPTPSLYASSPSTPYEYYETEQVQYPLPQGFHRSNATLYQYDTPSGSTTPLPTPPTQSPCYFPQSDLLYPPEPSTSRPRRQKSFTLPNPSPGLPTPPSYESSSVSRPAYSPSLELLAPPVTSRSRASDFTLRPGESSNHSTLEPPSAIRRRSSTLSVLSIPDGPNSDNSDGGDTSERHETITPFISKLSHLLREGTPWIQWNAQGTAFFFAHQRDEFGDQLARVFRHGSSHSFVRQLNIYNFKRLTPLELEHELESTARQYRLASGLASTDFTAFAHPLFFRGATCDLAKIKPKTPRKVSSKQQLLLATGGGSGLAPKSSAAPSPSSSSSSSGPQRLHPAPSPNRSLRSEGKVGGVARTKY